MLVIITVFAFGALSVFSQSKFDKLRIDNIEVSFGSADINEPLAEQYRLTAKDALGPSYALTRVRDAIEALYSTKKIDTISVRASINQAGGVDLKFDIKRKTQADKISVVVGQTVGDPVLEQDLLLKLNLHTPGTAITDQREIYPLGHKCPTKLPSRFDWYCRLIQ